MNPILKSVKASLLSFSPHKSLVESFVRFDFKIGDARENLMQACFSPIASWTMFVLMAIIAFDPFKATWSLSYLLSPDNSFFLYILDGRSQSMLVFFLAAFAIEWIIRREYLILFVLCYFLGRFELHTNLALSALLGVLLSRVCYQGWAALDLTEDAKKIWLRLHQVQGASWLIVSFASLWALDFLQANQLFQRDGLLTRFNFFVVVYALYQAISMIGSMIWGHFYFHSQKDPSHLFTHYSSAHFILRFSLGEQLVYELKNRVKEQLQKHNQHAEEYELLRQQSPGLANLPFSKVINSELSYLREASIRLDKI